MLTSDDRVLLIKVLRWARANGVTRTWLRWADTMWDFTDLARGYEVRLEVVDDESFELSVDHVARRLFQGWPTSIGQAVDVLSALDVLPAEFSTNYKAGHANGHEEAHYASKTQWGIRRAGFKTVRITSDTNARSLLRNFVVPAEMVMREVSPWEVVATNADQLARGER